MSVRLLFTVLVVMPGLCACGWLTGDEGYFRNRGDDYREANVTRPMTVPEGLDSEALQELYVIPPHESSGLLVGEFDMPRPEPIRSAESVASVRIQKLGEDRWILVDSLPSEVWPNVRAFLLATRLGVENESVEVGLIESAWLTSEDLPDIREKYRYRVEQGIQRRSTEVYVKQQSLPAIVDALPEAPDWPSNSNDDERESWMVSELANWLASTGDASSVSLMAQGLSTASKMYLVRDESGRPVIDLRLPYDRAWASLGRALQRGEFNVTDLDRDGGKYYVKYQPGKDDEPGFFGRLLGRDGKSDGPESEIGYIVDVNEIESGVMIGINREDGTALDEEAADLLLGVIRGNLT